MFFYVLFIGTILIGSLSATGDVANCEDHLQGNQHMSCEDLPNVCEDPISAHVMCPKTCDHCENHQDWLKVLELTNATCEDDLSCLKLIGLLGNKPHECPQWIKQICPRSCSGLNHTCDDHIQSVYNLSCSDLPKVCEDAKAAVFMCPKFCNLCDQHELPSAVDGCSPYNCNDSIPSYLCDCLSPLSFALCNLTCRNCVPEKLPTSTVQPTEPSTAPPTEPSTAPPTQPPTAPPTEPSTAPPTQPPTTPGPTTAPAPTSTTTRASTTTRPLANNRPGKQCLVCGDLENQIACNDMELVIAEMTPCPDSHPYCMNDIIETPDGVAQYKRCVNEADCDSLWYQATSDEPLCLHFDPNNGEDSLTCHLCCYGDGCNVDTIPPTDTLYRP